MMPIMMIIVIMLINDDHEMIMFTTMMMMMMMVMMMMMMMMMMMKVIYTVTSTALESAAPTCKPLGNLYTAHSPNMPIQPCFTHVTASN